MSALKKNILLFLHSISQIISKVKLWIGINLGFIRSIKIMPYIGFGNDKDIYFLGRVLKDQNIATSNQEDSSWSNFKKMYKRFMTWEILGAHIKAVINDAQFSTTSNEKGYFEYAIRLKESLRTGPLWRQVNLHLESPSHRLRTSPHTDALIFVPSKEVEFGVISDIDDTIVPTGATRLWEMIKTTFLGNAQTRIPFPGVSAFYLALSRGLVGRENNPFFYVSSSPWNLYDFLQELMEYHNIPKGPLMLRDLGLSKEHFIAGSHGKHKMRQIERILNIIRDLSFILIGDSGQHDAEIYLEVIKKFPGRVKVVYIRDVTTSENNKLNTIAKEASSLGVEMILIKNTMDAANHSISQGWIIEEDFQKISLFNQ